MVPPPAEVEAAVTVVDHAVDVKITLGNRQVELPPAEPDQLRIVRPDNELLALDAVHRHREQGQLSRLGRVDNRARDHEHRQEQGPDEHGAPLHQQPRRGHRPFPEGCHP